MEKKATTSNPESTCEKLLNFLSTNPFQFFSHASHQSQGHVPATPGPDYSSQPLPSAQEKEKPVLVHISIQDKAKAGKVSPKPESATHVSVQEEKPKNKAEVAPAAGPGKKKVELPEETAGKDKGSDNINDKVTDYINRTKNKIRNMASFRGGTGRSAS